MSESKSDQAITLYGTPLSLYTGKARSYLIKAGLPYSEVTIAQARYHSHVKGKAGTGSVPVLETAGGEVIRDGTKIIDFYEANSGAAFSPLTAKQRIISRLFDVIGSEGLLRPAMHYRWDFPEQNADFVRFHFETSIPAHMDKKVMAAKVMDRMRNAGQMFGAVAENFSLIEGLYEELLLKLNAHFSEQPYLLGGKPCIGDFGLMAPMYAHLGRDPAPLHLMQSKAVSVFRWVERMNRPEPDIGEMPDAYNHDYLGNDQIPQSLLDILSHIAVDFVPETLAAAKTINAWLGEHQPESDLQVVRGVGLCQFELRGHEVKALAQPYRFFLLKRVQDEYAGLEAKDQADVLAMLSECGLAEILNCRLDREIGWRDNLEVWV